MQHAAIIAGFPTGWYYCSTLHAKLHMKPWHYTNDLNDTLARLHRQPEACDNSGRGQVPSTSTDHHCLLITLGVRLYSIKCVRQCCVVRQHQLFSSFWSYYCDYCF